MNQVVTINKKKKRKGFTLIELIIVLAVMAIIAAIAIPNFTAVRDNSKNKADVQSAETIKRTVLMLVSDGTIKASDNTITFKDGAFKTGENDVDDKLKDANENKAFKEALKEVKAPQGKVDTTAGKKDAGKFSVEMKADGTVNVKPIE